MYSSVFLCSRVWVELRYNWLHCGESVRSNIGAILVCIFDSHAPFGLTLKAYSSKEYITGPLGMGSSFYLTPELKRRLVNLSFRDSAGGLNPWANQVNIIEQDPSKGGLIRAPISCSSCVSLTASCPSVRLHLGGVGMYSSMRDYLKILRHLMQINGRRQIAIIHCAHLIYHS